MTHDAKFNRIRERRTGLGLTQAQLAEQAGISRTAVTAIEGEQLVPSVAAALAIAEVLGGTVEQLFGRADSGAPTEIWAWPPKGSSPRCWRAKVGERTVHYPASSAPTLTFLPDLVASSSTAADETLVLACCDPASGLLASQFAAVSGLRLLVLPRSSRQAVEMLRDGLVHMAGLHLSTSEHPDRNSEVIRERLGHGCQVLRIPRGWQEGVAVTPTAKVRSVKAAVQARMTWVGREPGSGARQCLDQMLEGRPSPRRIARDHRGVTEAVRSGWADAGVCVQLASAEAGLDFLPVQEEAYDVCFPDALAGDRRIKAFLSVIRSPAYRKLLGELPGYSTLETGNVWTVN